NDPSRPAAGSSVAALAFRAHCESLETGEDTRLLLALTTADTLTGTEALPRAAVFTRTAASESPWPPDEASAPDASKDGAGAADPARGDHVDLRVGDQASATLSSAPALQEDEDDDSG